jgi:hypothetical protein
MEVSGHYHALAALYPWEKNAQYPLDRRLGGPQYWFGQRLEKKVLYVCRGLNPGHLPVQSEVRHYTD